MQVGQSRHGRAILQHKQVDHSRHRWVILDKGGPFLTQVSHSAVYIGGPCQKQEGYSRHRREILKLGWPFQTCVNILDKCLLFQTWWAIPVFGGLFQKQVSHSPHGWVSILTKSTEHLHYKMLSQFKNFTSQKVCGYKIIYFLKHFIQSLKL